MRLSVDCLTNNLSAYREKFTVGYFHMKIVCGKIFSSLRVSDEVFYEVF